MKRLLLVLALLVAVTACDPTPTASIEVRPERKDPLYMSVTHINGTVVPKGATPRVVLQRTVGGKWVDYKQLFGTGATTPTVRAGRVDPATGNFSIALYVEDFQTKHLRVRTNGGTVVSQGFYIAANQYET